MAGAWRFTVGASLAPTLGRTTNTFAHSLQLPRSLSPLLGPPNDDRKQGPERSLEKAPDRSTVGLRRLANSQPRSLGSELRYPRVANSRSRRRESGRLAVGFGCSRCSPAADVPLIWPTSPTTRPR
ncbi:hypothetical protein RA210_U400003 [Rubrivivax sp. A210]|nr:hypothetical protein RA210_U400003 [Rubrivivax sp. A210]